MNRDNRQQQVLFALGRLFSTPGALEALNSAEVHPGALIARHCGGDWGDLCDEDKRANDRALKQGGRIFSAYNIGGATRIWVITEADRQSTTILRPEEY